MATARSPKSNEPSAALFQRLRLTLALWYSAILAIALAITHKKVEKINSDNT